MLALLLAVLLATLGGGRPAAGYPARGSVLRPPDISYQSLPSEANTTWVEVQHTAWGSGLVLDSTKALGTDECVAACLDDLECAWSSWCGLETGCTNLHPPMEYQDCWMYSANCTLAPLVGDSGPQVERDSGLPVRQAVPDTPGFISQAAQAVEPAAQPGDGDLQCSQTVVPGRCAISSLQEAMAACLGMPACRTIVHYYNGTDGCSAAPLSLLISTPVSRTTSFLAPTALALIKLNYSGPGSPAAAPRAAPSSSSSSGGGGGGVSGAAIAGIAVGVVLALAAAAAVGWVAWRRRRHSSSRSSSSKASSWEGPHPGLKAVRVVAGHDSRAPSRTPLMIPSRPPSAVSIGTPRSVIVSRMPVARSPFARGPSFAREGGPFAPSAIPSLAYQPGSPKGSASPVTTAYTNVTLPLPTDQGSPGSSGASGAAAVAAGSGGAGAAGNSGPSPSSSSEEQMLPELKEHIAQCDALLSFGSSGLFGGGGTSVGDAEHTLLSPEQMSPSLRDWLVNIEDVTVLRHPNGALQELGCGACACVYKAVFRGEVVAAKEVDLGRSAAVQAAFLTEAERLHQLRHAHVVALYGVALAGSRGLILMEHCSGRDLHSVLQLKAFGTDERLFSWYRKGRRVALDIAKALNFLHSRSIVHFDIKSSNVLLTGTGTAKLADVGLARMQTRTYLTGLPHMVGTFSWVAPEVLLGGQSCTSAVDIYSFGVVLWEIITGEQPKRGQMRMPRVLEECPQEASDLMVQCMSLDPEQRPTAQQVMQRLAALQNHQEHQP